MNIILKEPIERDSIVLECFPGMGLVGHIAANYLIEKLEMKVIGYIESRDLPPVVFFKNGIVEPPLKIYKKDKLVILHSDILIPPEMFYDLSEKLSDLLEKSKIKMLISLGGLSSVTQQRKIYGVANSREALEELKKYNIEILEDGTISGITGLLLYNLSKKNIKSIAILVETIGLRPDPAGAAALINVLNNILDLKVDVKPLLEEAKKLEEKLEEMSHALRRMKQREEKLPMFA